ncbi:MAG: DNA recombination protein RmuC [Clostridia bacterium]
MPIGMNVDLYQLVLVLLIVLMLVLVVISLWLPKKRQGKIIAQLNEAKDHLAQELAVVQDMVLRQGIDQREELSRVFTQQEDHQLRMLSSISKAQGDQVNALLKQSFDNAQAFDLRQQGMQRITEESLRRMEARMQSIEAGIGRQLSQNELRMETLRKAVEGGLNALRTDNAQKLDEMRKTVDEKLHDTLEKRLNASFAQVSSQLEQVYKSLGEMHNLAAGVGDLKRMLGNVKTRGVWGEMQLSALLEQVLTNTQYERNVAVVPGSQERVEFAVVLPGHGGDRPVYLPIDSKFPQEDYARLTEAAQSADQAGVENAQRSLLNAVRIEAKRIGKYIAPPYTTDFAVMFLPLEGLYAEVMRHSDVVEQIQREQRILISGPSTLLALLNSLQMGFRTLAIEQRSAEVWKLLGAVKADFGSFAQILQKTQEKLQQATDSIDTAFVRTRSIEKKLRKVEALDSGEASEMLAQDDL